MSTAPLAPHNGLTVPSGGVPATVTNASDVFTAYINDDTTRSMVQRAVVQRGWSPKQVKSGGLQAAARTLGLIAAPEILLVDVSDVENAPEALQSLGEAIDAGTKILTIGTKNDVSLYRQMIQAGAYDYLVKPLDAAAIDRMIGRAEQPNAGADGKALGRVIVVTGARGGVGSSTVAAEIAWAVSTKYGRRTALLDLDLRWGTSALGFDVPPGQGLAEALAAPDRIDDLLLERAATSLTPMLSLYAAEEGIDGPEPSVAGAIAMIDVLARKAPVLVVDLPARSSVLDAVTSRAKDVIVVSDPTLTGLRDTIRLTKFLEPLGEDVAVSVLLNRVPKRGGPVPLNHFEKQLGRKVTTSIALDDDSAQAAMRAGQPCQIANPRGAFSKDLSRYAATFFPPPKKQIKPRALLKRIGLG